MEINLKDLLIKELGLKDNTISLDDSSFTLTEWDSLAHVALIGEIEKIIGKKLEAKEASRMTSIKGIISILKLNGFEVFRLDK